MTSRIKRAVFVSVVFIFLVILSGCSTTAGVGVGYHIPISPHSNVGMGFGIGF